MRVHLTSHFNRHAPPREGRALRREAAEALGLEGAAPRLEAAQWADEQLRQALPLSLCGRGGSFTPSRGGGARWLAHAQALLRTHLGASMDARLDSHPDAHLGAQPSAPQPLLEALDAALRRRRASVEAKVRQLEEFAVLAPGPGQAGG